MMNVSRANRQTVRNTALAAISGRPLVWMLALLVVSFFARVEAQTLTNPGFEGAYSRVPTSTDGTCNGATPANISGEIAADWIDESSWADVEIIYSKESANPRSGSTAQKVDVRAVRCGGAQMLQAVRLQCGYKKTACTLLGSGLEEPPENACR
jgi:hypothetical protein